MEEECIGRRNATLGQFFNFSTTYYLGNLIMNLVLSTVIEIILLCRGMMNWIVSGGKYSGTAWNLATESQASTECLQIINQS